MNKMKNIITKCISTAAEPQTSDGEEEEQEGSSNSLDVEIQIPAKKTTQSKKNATMLKKFSVFTSNHRLSSSTSSSSGSGSGASGTSQISSNPNPESSSSSSSSAASSSSSSSKVKKTIYHHHNHHHNHHHHNLPHIQSYQSLSSVNPSSIDTTGGKSGATASKHNSFIGSKPLNRNSRRVSMYELGYGKTESYTKLEKLGEVIY
jgi:hypothetical protein